MIEPIVRFQRLYVVDDATECWLWIGFVKSNGYAQFRPGRSAPPGLRPSVEL